MTQESNSSTDYKLETLTKCPACESMDLNPYLICNDYLVSKQAFTIQQCKSCGLRFTNPRPDFATIGSYYKSDQYVSHNDAGSGLLNSLYRIVRNYTLSQKLKLINSLNGGAGRLLDVGCGTGTFLEKCQNNDWTVAGMEPDNDARQIAEKRLNIKIETDLSAIGRTIKFDVITLWHVLEHITNLKQSIQQLRQLLNEEGTLIVAVPNSDSYDAHHYKQYWAAYDVPRHLYHFTPKTIEPLFAQFGLKLIETRPMVFDAFYIAMLSSRHKVGKTNYIESLQLGLLSNLRANRSGQSSSITYIFQKI